MARRRKPETRPRHWQRDQPRDYVLRREPLCRSCAAHGRVTLAVHVDHIWPKHRGGSDDLANLQPLCEACHEAKTLRERGITPKQPTPLDGW